MRMKRLWLVLMIVSITVVFSCLAQAQDLTGTAAFMNLGVGARALGMGGTAVALVDDSSAVYHNPAALAYIEESTLTSSYSKDWSQVGLMAGTFNISGIGLGVINLRANDVDQLDQLGNVLGQFDVNELVGMVGYGFSLGDGIALGATGKYYRQTLSEKSAQGITVDVGALLKQGDFSIGISARNLMGSVKDSNGNEDAFDRNVVIGGAWAKDKIALGFDMDLQGTKRVGAEYDLGVAKVRVGGYLQDEFSFSLGLGLNVESFEIDYAYLAPAHLAATHRFTVVFK